MILLRERLAELLFRQSWNDVTNISFIRVPNEIKDRYLEQADGIIDFFVDAIKNSEFKTTSSVPDEK